MAKSPDAFRTISEVADWLGIQAHVLRFWESKFTQVKPIKRAGGRRYYRPSDMQLLGGIKKLLHDDGLTIKGVQKILREEGMNHVAAMSAPLDELTASQMDDMPDPAARPQTPPAESEKGVVLSFESAAEKTAKNSPEDIEEETESSTQPAESREMEAQETAVPEAAPAEPSDDPVAQDRAAPPPTAPDTQDPEPQADIIAAEDQTEQPPKQTLADEPLHTDTPTQPDPDAGEAPSTGSDPLPHDPVTAQAPDDQKPDDQEPETEQDTTGDKPALPAFLRRPLNDDPAPETSDNTPPKPVEEPQDATADMPQETGPEPDAPAPEAAEPAPKPRVLPDIDIPAEQDIEAVPATLSAAYRLTSLSRTRATKIEPLVAQLAALRDSMAARRRSGGGPPSNT